MNPDTATPLVDSPDRWLQAVLEDFPAFLCDHASCEKKASGMALNIASHYPDRPVLVRAMSELAVEELSHWREVTRILLDQGIRPRADDRDPYVHALQGLIRKGPEAYLLDRLLIAAIIERRGAERFGRIGEALAETASPFAGLSAFYRALAASESRHWETFLYLATTEFEGSVVSARFHALHAAESDIMRDLPARPRLH